MIHPTTDIASFIVGLTASVGATWIITHGSIFGPVRRAIMRRAMARFERDGEENNAWQITMDFTRCNQCSGWWAGAAVSLLMSLTGNGFLEPWWAACVLMAMSSSALCDFVDRVWPRD